MTSVTQNLERVLWRGRVQSLAADAYYCIARRVCDTISCYECWTCDGKSRPQFLLCGCDRGSVFFLLAAAVFTRTLVNCCVPAGSRLMVDTSTSKHSVSCERTTAEVSIYERALWCSLCTEFCFSANLRTLQNGTCGAPFVHCCGPRPILVFVS